MNAVLQELHNRNKLLVKLFGGCLLLGMGASYDSPATIVTLGSVGIPIILLTGLLVWRRWATMYIMYMISIGLSMIAYFYLQATTSYANILILYLCLAIVSVYHEVKPLVLNGSVAIVLLNLFLMTKPEFAEVDVKGANAFLVLTVAALVTQSRIGFGMRKRMEESSQASEEARAHAEQVLAEVTASSQQLASASANLQVNADMTGKISKEVALAFQDIAGGIESQASSVSDITSAVQEVNSTVGESTSASVQMSEASRITVALTEQGRTQMEVLAGRIDSISRIVRETAELMDRVNEQNEKIGSIVTAITGIAAQTNMLSLNASIEAARAGEHGRGFAVVSDEIRKLARHTHQSSEDIASILGAIQTNVSQVTDRVRDGLLAVDSGKQSAVEVERLFEDITENSGALMAHADQLQRLNTTLATASDTVSGEMTSVAAISEQSAAAVEEILASAEMQQHQVEQMVQRIHEVNELVQRLDRLIIK